MELIIGSMLYFLIGAGVFRWLTCVTEKANIRTSKSMDIAIAVFAILWPTIFLIWIVEFIKYVFIGVR